MGRHDCGYFEQYVLFINISTTQNLENILVQIVNLIRIPQMRTGFRQKQEQATTTDGPRIFEPVGMLVFGKI
jgi:hypothetical protein